MEFRSSHRVHNVKIPLGASIRSKLDAMRASGQEVINLVSGESDFKAPAGLAEATLAGGPHDSRSDGAGEALRAALREKLERSNGLRYEPDQIFLSTSCTQAIFDLMQAILDPDDEVIIPAPYWASYPEMARLAAADPVIVRTTLDHGFKITPEQLRGVLSDKTRLVVLNSPAHPCGAHYEAGELRALGAALLEHPEVLVLADDTSEHLLWTGQPFENFLNACPMLFGRTIVVNATPRLWGLGTFGVGYVAGQKKLVQALHKLQIHTEARPNPLAEAMALAVQREPEAILAARRAELKRRHDNVVEALGAIAGVSPLPSSGSFHLLADVSEVIQRTAGVQNDVQIAERLLADTGVAALPGSAVGAVGCLRFCFAGDPKLLDAALGRITEHFKEP